jgi:isoquinoline 1-oxidoreductase subunit beta
MSAPATVKVNRRGFLQVGASATAGLLVGFYLPERSKLAAQANAAPLKMNAWVHIALDDTVTFMIHKVEMGQGTVTSLSQLLAEELECDWGKFRTEFPPVDKAFGPMQGVVGSQSIRTSWDPLRKAGATAREMLVEAAAQNWGVDKSKCRAESGFVINTTNNARLSYGKLADAAAKLPVPTNVALKDPKLFRIAGKSVKRLDTPAKVTGRTQFGIDARLPGMVYAAVARCPVFGGKVASFDDTKAKAFPGVKRVVPVSRGVAVVADNTWSAIQGTRLLEIKWDEGANATQTSANISKIFAERAQKPGVEISKAGDAAAGLAGAAKKVEAVYEAPFLAHATMEPMNCTAQVVGGKVAIWVPTQVPQMARQIAARVAGVPVDDVTVHVTLLGGGFGRRLDVDYVAQAVRVAMDCGGAPVQLIWPREEDMRHDFYRPMHVAMLRGTLDAQGNPSSLRIKSAGDAITPRWMERGLPALAGPVELPDKTTDEGLFDQAYAFPHQHMEHVATHMGVPVGFWRSVGHSHNAFFTESFIDELAAAAGRDPVDFRRKLLEGVPRYLAVLNLAAEKAGWGGKLPAGRARGVALHESFGSVVAQVAEVSIESGRPRVHRIVCAMDCGTVVNPNIVAQQLEGSVILGLTAALYGKIDIVGGAVQQGNFPSYPMVRMAQAPRVETWLVASERAPSGVGEPGVPPVAPSVANALFALTGKRHRELPLASA